MAESTGRIVNQIGEWDTSKLIKFVKEVFEKDPPIQLSKLTVDEMTVRELLTVSERSVFTETTRVFSVGRPGAPAFENSWVNHDAAGTRAAKYWKDAFGHVHLSGIIKNGTMSATAFQLPPGYRHGEGDNVIFPATANSLFGSVYISPAGLVVPFVGSNIWFSLNGIYFRAA